MIKRPFIRRGIALFLLVQFSTQVFLPAVSYALTSGPNQPEFSSFEPVSSSNMVDEFTGDFTYNVPVLEVPGPHGSGYPLSLSYHSGVTPEEEASWVGYGWTLNAGAITRNTRGIPDDFNGKTITYHNKMPKNWTATVGGGLSFGELFSVDISLGFNTSIRYNNYRGFGYNAGAGIALGKGVVSMGYNVSDGEGSYSLNVNPTAALNSYLENHGNTSYNVETFETRGSRAGKKTSEVKTLKLGSQSLALAGSQYGIFSFNEYAKPTAVHDYSGKSFNVSIGLQTNVVPIPVGTTGNVFGSYSFQTNDDTETPSAYGYMYSAGGKAKNANVVMDYHVEKETTFNKRDVFLGVPFNDADNFMVTGEGIGGGFRMYNKKNGHFGPRAVSSGVDIFNAGGEIALGWTFGSGVDIGKGKQTMKVGDWKKELSDFASPTDATLDEPVFFRFNNDLGGEWGSNQNDNPVQASISSKMPSVQASLFENDPGKRSGRSSYIGYNTNADMLLTPTGTAPSVKAYNKNAVINTQSARSGSDTETKDLIGEIAVHNESGSRYLYALPVYSKMEKSNSYNPSRVSSPQTNIENNYLIFPQTETALTNGKVKVGQDQNNKYASSFLMTEITTPDYLDKTADGPSQDDLGGYTRFNYLKVSTSSDYYNWRAPYRGLIYNINSQSDPKDDQASYSEGEKEIYFLRSIETKSHVAIFTISNRDDSQEAAVFANSLMKTGTPGSIQMRKLDKIDLYSVNDCQKNGTTGLLIRDANGSPTPNAGAKPIKTVYFKYNTSLSTGLPNAASGKLTLERMHFEYANLTTTRISPYIFSYAYPADYSTYPDKYETGLPEENVTQNYRDLTTTQKLPLQNPKYSYFHSDAWGNYQPAGWYNFKLMRTWVNQTKVANVDFDPAAWHLKVIKLPSGGEIHVQYEQDDYSYVQDQEAHVMAPLMYNADNGFVINTDSIGFNSIQTKQRLADMIKKRYVQGGQKMYFKFLYKLINSGQPALGMCHSDFISGYASVTNVSYDGTLAGLVSVTLASSGSNKLPKEVCKEFVKTQRLGMLDPNGNCMPGMNEGTGTDDKNKAAALVRQLYSMAQGIVAPQTMCQELSPANSYLRVPTPIAKKGGGVRVKRLMLFDSNTNGAPVLYGNEYLYQTTENGRTISSGVATNEPQAMREENILVNFVARKSQSLWSKVIAGKDKKQAEGPLGESVLPAPSVGYSKVIVRNIHTGKTSPGFSISEFFTAKDFPISLAHPDKSGTITPINAPTPEKRYLIGILVNIIKDKSWASQGFSFILNNMHGQVKSKSTYNGPANDATTLAKSTLVSRISHEYFEPGEKIPVMSSLFGDIALKNPGREVDITFAQKKVEESSYDANVEGDIELSIIYAVIPVVLFYPTAMPTMNFTEGVLNTHATTKVVRYPAMLKKTTVFQDGILHTEENLAFDQYTGKPVAVRSSDEYKGAYLAQSIPASWEYPNYKPKAESENKLIKPSGTTFSYSNTGGADPKIQFAGTTGCSTLGEITTGDIIDLGSGQHFQVKRLDYSRDLAELVYLYGTAPSTLAVSEVRILRTGKTNELGESAGNVTFHNQVAANAHPAAIRQPESQRYISSGSDANDGSLFISDLNAAFANPSLLPLDGPYHHMNLSQYIDRLPEGCAADLSDASVRNVNIIFKTNNGNVKIEMGTFEIQCGGTWQLVRMPE
jgi:hypothetical protein